jgi:hypothetical protein
MGSRGSAAWKVSQAREASDDSRVRRAVRKEGWRRAQSHGGAARALGGGVWEDMIG